MIAIAVLTRDGVSQCTGTVDTPIGNGNSSDESKANLSFGMACKLEKVTFAVAIIGIFLFLISILFQVLLARHHKREKRFGPSPANGYTSGSRRRWWRRNKSPEAGSDALPGHPTPGEVEMDADTKNEKNWFGSWGHKNKDTTAAPAANGSGAVQNGTGYGYGNSAYTGNI